MSEHDETLRKTLEEVTRLRTEREESVREVATGEYAGRLRYAERIYFLYALVCIVLGVGAINFFTRSYDLKTLIGCAVVMLVVYETSVLLKLWYATARMKMDVLKEMKLLRLDVARLGTAVGVEQPSQPPVRYEPMRGLPSYERTFWICVCVFVAIAASSWTSHMWFGGGEASTDTVVTLSADGSAESRTDTERAYAGYYLPKGFSYYTAKDTNARFLDPTGHEMPVELVATDTNHRHDITFTESVFSEGKMRYTRILDEPKAAKLEDGVWTYRDGLRVAGQEQDYSITMLLPPGAKLLSTEPEGEVDVDEDGRTRVRFEGTTVYDVQHLFTIRYELPAVVEEE